MDSKDQYPNLGQALFVSMQGHSWYLSEQLVLLSLSVDDIEEKLKSDKEKRLLTIEIAEQFRIGKPELPVILMSTELSELVGPQIWLLLKVAEIPERKFKSDKGGSHPFNPGFCWRI